MSATRPVNGWVGRAIETALQQRFTRRELVGVTVTQMRGFERYTIVMVL